MSTSRRMWPEDMTVSGKGGYEKIKDKDGVNRFVEGEIAADPSGDLGLPAGMECTYRHWSLSGNHLMVVLAGRFTGDHIDQFSSVKHGFDVHLPKTIYDKLVPLGDRGVICTADVWFWDNSYGREIIGTMEAFKYKDDTFLSVGALQTNQAINSKGSSWRVVFDILIS